MFGLSFGEIFVIAVIGLIILGPERLPKVARTMGHLLGRAQRYMNDVKSDIQREMDIQDLSKLKDDLQQTAVGVRQQVESGMATLRDPLETVKQEMGSTAQQLKQELTQLPDIAELTVSTTASHPVKHETAAIEPPSK